MTVKKVTFVAACRAKGKGMDKSSFKKFPSLHSSYAYCVIFNSNRVRIQINGSNLSLPEASR